VLVLTFGTGIGSALFIDGKLVPNTELGHIDLGEHHDVETWAAARVRKEQDLSWKKRSKRVKHYLEHLEALFSPDLFIIGGGVSKKSDKFFELLELHTPYTAAEMQNEAGIIGAAMAAYDISQATSS
jgi:polyphosphate glucokinase